jgi:hypothetical protein
LLSENLIHIAITAFLQGVLCLQNLGEAGERQGFGFTRRRDIPAPDSVSLILFKA